MPPGATVVSTGGGIQSWVDLRRELEKQHGGNATYKDRQAAKYAMKKQYDRFLTQEALKTLSRVQDQWGELDAHIKDLQGVADKLGQRIQVRQLAPVSRFTKHSAALIMHSSLRGQMSERTRAAHHDPNAATLHVYVYVCIYRNRRRTRRRRPWTVR
jgi:hypothetical protein